MGGTYSDVEVCDSFPTKNTTVAAKQGRATRSRFIGKNSIKRKASSRTKPFPRKRSKLDCVSETSRSALFGQHGVSGRTSTLVAEHKPQKNMSPKPLGGRNSKRASLTGVSINAPKHKRERQRRLLFKRRWEQQCPPYNTEKDLMHRLTMFLETLKQFEQLHHDDFFFNTCHGRIYKGCGVIPDDFSSGHRLQGEDLSEVLGFHALIFEELDTSDMACFKKCFKKWVERFHEGLVGKLDQSSMDILKAFRIAYP
jgi:hypothetical protein